MSIIDPCFTCPEEGLARCRRNAGVGSWRCRILVASLANDAGSATDFVCPRTLKLKQQGPGGLQKYYHGLHKLTSLANAGGPCCVRASSQTRKVDKRRRVPQIRMTIINYANYEQLAGNECCPHLDLIVVHTDKPDFKAGCEVRSMDRD